MIDFVDAPRMNERLCKYTSVAPIHSILTIALHLALPATLKRDYLASNKLQATKRCKTMLRKRPQHILPSDPLSRGPRSPGVLSLQRARHQHLPKIRRSQPRNRIPPHRRIESRSRNPRTPPRIHATWHLEVITSDRPSRRNIIEHSIFGDPIKPRIQKPQRRLPARDPCGVQQRDQACKHWGRS